MKEKLCGEGLQKCQSNGMGERRLRPMGWDGIKKDQWRGMGY